LSERTGTGNGLKPGIISVLVVDLELLGTRKLPSGGRGRRFTKLSGTHEQPKAGPEGVGHDCKDAGGRATQEQLPRESPK